MNFQKIAKASLLPTALAGVALTVGVAVAAEAAPVSDAAPAAAARSYAASIGTVQQRASAAVHTAATAADKAAVQAVTRAHAEAAARAKAAAAAQAKARAAARAQSQVASTSPASITAGMSAFEQCVAYRESGDNPTDPAGLFGILPSTWQSLGYSGTAGQASVAVQKAAFSKLYAMDGTAPWAPYDGC